MKLNCASVYVIEPQKHEMLDFTLVPKLLDFFQIFIIAYSPYYAEACNELRGPSPRLSAWATQLRRNVATVASRWRHCVDLTGPGVEPLTSRTDSVRFATELTAGSQWNYNRELVLLKVFLGGKDGNRKSV